MSVTQYIFIQSKGAHITSLLKMRMSAVLMATLTDRFVLLYVTKVTRWPVQILRRVKKIRSGVDQNQLAHVGTNNQI